MRAHTSILKALPIGTGVALCLLCSPARAQLVDYGTLESLFGEPVTTSATGVPQRASDVPINMTIITADQIRQSGTRSIPQIIGLYVPGVDILRGASNSYDIGIRGYQQPFQSGLLVLVDGRQVFVDDYSRTIWDNLPVNVDDIRQIEVIKGASSAFSALFGSNAAYGVINILTYSPFYDNNRVGNLTVGTQQTITGDGTYTFKGDGWGSKVTAGGLNANEFNINREPGDTDPYKPLHSYVVNNSVFQLSPSFQISTEANYSESRSNIADLVDGFTEGDQKTTSYSAGAGFSWRSPIGVISGNNYFNKNYSVISEPGSDGGAAYGQNTELFVSQVQDQFKIGTSHIFRVGLEYRWQDFLYGYGAEVDPISPDLRENNMSANGMWLWQINDKLSLTNAFRLDSQNMYEAGTLWSLGEFPASSYTHSNLAWSANSGIVYKMTDKDTISLGWGRGILLPSMLESGGNILQNFGPNFLLDGEGNPDLKPTIVNNYELDYTRSVPEIFSTVRISPYFTQTRDIMYAFYKAGNTITDGSGNVFQPEVADNIGGSNAYGGEVEIKGNKDKYRWAASYSFSYVKDDTNVFTSQDYQGSAPENHFRLLLGYTTGPWEFDGNGQFITSTSMIRSVDSGLTWGPVHTGDYFSIGGRIGYAINDNFTLALMGTNLSQAYTQESPYPAVARQIFLSLTGKF